GTAAWGDPGQTRHRRSGWGRVGRSAPIPTIGRASSPIGGALVSVPLVSGSGDRPNCRSGHQLRDDTEKLSLEGLALTARPARHQRVAWFGLVDDLVGRFDPGNGQVLGIELANLDEDGGLIPINVLMGHLSVLKANDRNQWDFNLSPCRWYAREHPV